MVVQVCGIAMSKALSHNATCQGLSLTDAIGPHIRDMRELRHLSLMYTMLITDAIVQYLHPALLRTLKLPYRPTGDAVVTDAALTALCTGGFLQLRSLTVGGKGM